MKKLSVLLVIIYFSFNAFAQDGDLRKVKYFRFGPSIPTKGYFGRDKSEWDNATRLGAVLEGGTIYMLNGIRVADRARFGIDYSYIGLQYHHFKTDYTDYTLTEGAISLFTKVGPSFTYSPTSVLAFDVYFKAYVPLLALTYATEDGADANDLDMYGGYLGLGYATGINFRYSLLLVNVEFNTANIRLEDADYGGYYGNETDESTQKTPMSCIQITIGMNF